MDKLSRQFIKYCEKNNLAKVNKCLSLGVDVNTVSGSESEDYNQGQTALMIACKYGHSAIISRLVQVPGLDINYSDTDYGWTAAHLASHNGMTECVVILAETGRVDWNKKDDEGKTPLYNALEDRHDDIISIIAKQPNIDYNVKTNDGETLAQIAVDGPYENVRPSLPWRILTAGMFLTRKGTLPSCWLLRIDTAQKKLRSSSDVHGLI